MLLLLLLLLQDRFQSLISVIQISTNNLNLSELSQGQTSTKSVREVLDVQAVTLLLLLLEKFLTFLLLIILIPPPPRLQSPKFHQNQKESKELILKMKKPSRKRRGRRTLPRFPLSLSYIPIPIPPPPPPQLSRILNRSPPFHQNHRYRSRFLQLLTQLRSHNLK